MSNQNDAQTHQPKKRKGESKTPMSELEAVKRLLVLLLIKQGASNTEIGLALSVDRTTIGRMFPSDVVKRGRGHLE
jgi:ATP/maltotriose-dependent transcriptional regulator MalT